jgi:putative transposase
MFPKTSHRSHKGLNNRAENAHQPTRRKEKCWIKFKSPRGVQKLLSLMGKVRNLFAVFVNRYKHKAPLRRELFDAAKSIWDNAASQILHI